MSSDHRKTREADRIVDHVQFVRGLARALVSDPDAADDIAQESLAVAMTTPGDRIRRGMQRWLSGVVRNHARAYHRSQRTRREREAEATSRRLVDDTLERAELRRTLVDHVLALPEPYRHTLLLRYMEEMSPRAIGAALGRPVTTVKTHLQRGLERLRERLDRNAGGDRRTWQLAVVAMLGPVLPPATASPDSEHAGASSAAAGAASAGPTLKLAL